MLSTLLLINAPPPAPHDNNYFKILGNSKKGAKSVNLDLICTLQKFCFTCKKSVNRKPFLVQTKDRITMTAQWPWMRILTLRLKFGSADGLDISMDGLDILLFYKLILLLVLLSLLYTVMRIGSCSIFIPIPPPSLGWASPANNW